MTFPKEMTMYCAICGGPIFEPGVNNPEEWLGYATLLHSEDSAQPDASILEQPATNKGGPYFELSATNEQMTACDIGVRNYFLTPKPPLYIPSHTACIQIAYQVCTLSTRFKSESESLRHIWKVLEKRFNASSERRSIPPTRLNEPSGFRGALWKFQDMSWEPGENPELRYESQHFEADPLTIPGTTKSILSHLEQVPSNSETPSRPQDGLTDISSKLPPEICYHIIDQLGALSNVSLDCTFALSQSFWRSALFDRVVLPWLPELDARSFEKKEAELPAGREWNWELLVRQLAQSNIYEPKKVLRDLPLGLRNRRRIWTLVEDMIASHNS